MTSNMMATGYIEWAKNTFEEVERAFSKGRYPVTVRRAQECVELAIKGVFRLLSIEFPKEHNVSKVLLDISPKLPVWFQREVGSVSMIIKGLSEDRGPAMYGFEKELKPPNEIFGKEEGEKAINNARYVMGLCERFFDEWLNR